MEVKRRQHSCADLVKNAGRVVLSGNLAFFKANPESKTLVKGREKKKTNPKI